MTITSILRDGLKISFTGRINRTVYWVGLGIWLAIFLAVLFICSRVVPAKDDQASVGAYIATGSIFAFELVSISLTARRCHDVNRSGWFQIVSIIPLGAFWVLAKCGFERGTPGDNDFGAPYGMTSKEA